MNNFSHLTFVTGNAGKAQEMQALLPGIQILKADLPEIQEVDGKKIIAAKLMVAFAHASGPLLVDDTGLYMDCFQGNLPGPLIKWFLHAIKNTGLAAVAAQLGKSDAVGKTILGYAESPENIHYFEGVIHGTVVPPHGVSKHSFGWDSIFKPRDYDMTFADMDFATKNSMSMRATAVAKLREHLTKRASLERPY